MTRRWAGIDAYSDKFARLCLKADVPLIRMHSARHTLALTMWPAPVQEFVFADISTRAGVVQRFFVDPRTAQLIEERRTQPKLVNTTTTLVSDDLDSVPNSVRRTAVHQE